MEPPPDPGRFNPEDQPASILLTTLAARGYRGEITISAALEQVVGAMPTHIEVREDGLWVPNPAQPEENFADKWNTDPDRKQHFDTWLRALSGKVAGWSSTAGLEAITSSMSDSFGPGPVTTGAKAFADRWSEAGAAGALGVTAAGRVTRSAPDPIPKHTFHHGQRPPR